MYNVHLSAVTFIKVLITFVYSVLIDKKLSFSFSYRVVIRSTVILHVAIGF